MDPVPTRASLLARLADGSDELAWREFHQLYGGLITRVATRRGLQPADCDDVAQNVLIRLSRAMKGFEYDAARGRFRGYLKRVVMSEIADRARQSRGRRPVSASEEVLSFAAAEPEAERIWEEEWRHHHVERAMRVIETEFGEKDRLAFEHYATQGRGAEETATMLGLSLAQVYQAKSRILRRLADLVASQVKQEEGDAPADGDARRS